MGSTKPLSSHPAVGLGGSDVSIAVYIANQPPLPEFQDYSTYRAMNAGEIRFIADQTGNHWRKVFNVYAKLAFEINKAGFSSWQSLRDEALLQQASDYSLLFSEPDLSMPVTHIIMGKTYAKSLGLENKVEWLSNDFAMNEQLRLIVCPYFDYRQLSNIKIDYLVGLLNKLGL